MRASRASSAVTSSASARRAARIWLSNCSLIAVPPGDRRARPAPGAGGLHRSGADAHGLGHLAVGPQGGEPQDDAGGLAVGTRTDRLGTRTRALAIGRERGGEGEGEAA